MSKLRFNSKERLTLSPHPLLLFFIVYLIRGDHEWICTDIGVLGKKSDKQKAKQAQFDEERDMDMDDEEESSFHNSSVKGEHFDDSNGIRDTPNFVVKNERNYDGEDSGYDASPSPAAPHLTTFAASQNDGSSSPRPLVQALHNSSISSPLEAANAADAAYLARWTPQPGFGGGPGYTFSHQADTNNGTMPQGEFDFNNYTPRQHTPTPFFSGTREPEEVQPAETIVGCGDGAGGKRVQGEGETVIQVD